ncbi:MAG: ammonium transporter [Candidatus Methanoperedens sp.]|nr:ammonium transporter [Candidatus Methanoperedens sp.]MCZ7394422.1 ammonium transporter [Candidatus Methanoperedens sp.]
MEDEKMNIKSPLHYLKYILLSAIPLLVLADAAYAAAPQIDKADTAWVLASAALVMIMIPGVGLFYGGMVRKKNAISTIILSFAILALISVQWVLFGYSLAFGPDVGGVIGNLHWAGLIGVGQEPNNYATTIPALAFMIFQAMFAIIAVALITGAFVERIKFSAFLIFSFLWATLVYDPIAHWVWSAGGWLHNLGVLDFAGGAVVHISAGMSALAIALVIGARKDFGKYTMEPHSIPITMLGAALLWFGWFGFNAGSAVTSNGVAASAFVATNTAGAVGALTWTLLGWYYKKPTALGMATGAVVGLAAITPASGFVTPLAAMVIGAVAAVICYYAMLFRMKQNVDESLDVWACHGIGGIWGIIAVGIFATTLVNPAGSGLIDNHAGQVVTQLIAVVATSVYAFVATFILSKVIDSTIGLRVRDEEEAVGLDIAQHAEKAYS